MKKLACCSAIALLIAMVLAPAGHADIVYNSFLIENLSPVPQTYTVWSEVPVSQPLTAPIQMRGSIDTSLIGPDATIMAPLDSAIYTAFIDGTAVWKMQPDPFVLSTPQPAVSASEQFGWVGEDTSVAQSIGIELNFTLSPGARASVLSDFEVTPEPATLGLIGLGGLLMVWRRRR